MFEVGLSRLDGKRMAAGEDRARRDAMKAIARDIPDPALFARLMPLVLADALAGAWHPSGRICEWQVAEGHAVLLRPWGLCEYGGRCLTGFGVSVRRVLIEADA